MNFIFILEGGRMDILENVNEVGERLLNNINLNLENLQNNFLKTNLGQITNIAIDLGLKALLPDFVENEVIEVKDALLQGGIEEAIDTTLENAIEIGKKAIGISNSDFKNIEQVKSSIKKGNYIDGISSSLNIIIDGLNKSNILSDDVLKAIKDGKDVIVNNVDTNVENEFENEMKALKKIEKYIENWKKEYLNKNLEGMNKEFKKIDKQMNKLIPLENIIRNVENIKTINYMIDNNPDFDFDKVYLELSNQI